MITENDLIEIYKFSCSFMFSFYTISLITDIHKPHQHMAAFFAIFTPAFNSFLVFYSLWLMIMGRGEWQPKNKRKK